MRIVLKNTLASILTVSTLQFCTSVIAADDLFIWVDGKGVTHITTEAPQRSEAKGTDTTKVLTVTKAEAASKKAPEETKETSEEAVLTNPKPEPAPQPQTEANAPQTQSPTQTPPQVQQTPVNDQSQSTLLSEIEALKKEMSTVQKRAHIAKANGDKSKLAHLRHQGLKLTNRLKELEKKLADDSSR